MDICVLSYPLSCLSKLPSSFCRFSVYHKFAQSNFGRGPRGGTVAHVRRKVPIGYNGVTQIRPPKSTPSHGRIPKPDYVPHPWTRPTYDAKRHPNPIRRFSTIHWTVDWTDRQTDRPRKSLTTTGRCASKATRPNDNITYIRMQSGHTLFVDMLRHAVCSGENSADKHTYTDRQIDRDRITNNNGCLATSANKFSPS